MSWPSAGDYEAALYNPRLCFRDSELRSGEAEDNPRGGKMVWSGNFASVYKISCGNGAYAVRCFTRRVNDQQARYDHLHAFLQGRLPPAFVEFQFHPEGIRVRGEWYPIVKMDWVKGSALDVYVRDNLGDRERLSRIARRWRGVAESLQRDRGIAHNDLQQGNVMVQEDGTIRLVDYDGVFLPQYRGERSPEIGHDNFKHPWRKDSDYDEGIDNFPAFVIYLSLRALAVQPDLWQQFYNDDNLIFKKSDFEDPARSGCFRSLRNSPEDGVRNLAVRLEEYCGWGVDQVPDLESILSGDFGAPRPARRLALWEAGLGGNSGARRPASATGPVPASQPAPSALGSAPVPQSALSPQRSSARQSASSPQRPSVPRPASAVLPSGFVECPRCGHVNLKDLIYCEREECCAALHLGGRYCTHCGMEGPINAVYCGRCGRKVA